MQNVGLTTCVLFFYAKRKGFQVRIVKKNERILQKNRKAGKTIWQIDNYII